LVVTFHAPIQKSKRRRSGSFRQGAGAEAVGAIAIIGGCAGLVLGVTATARKKAAALTDTLGLIG
jgi:hypothetical protein